MRRLLIRSWFVMSCDLVWTWMCLGVIYIYIELRELLLFNYVWTCVG